MKALLISLIVIAAFLLIPAVIATIFFREQFFSWLENMTERMKRWEGKLDDKMDVKKQILNTSKQPAESASVDPLIPIHKNLFDFDLAVADFEAAGLISKPDQALLDDIIDNGDLEKNSEYYDYHAKHFYGVLESQDWTLIFEADNPGKHVSDREITDFVSNIAGESDPNLEKNNNEREIDQVVEVGGRTYSYYKSPEPAEEFDLERSVAKVNQALIKLKSKYRCVIGHYDDEWLALLVAEEAILLPLMEKHALHYTLKC